MRGGARVRRARHGQCLEIADDRDEGEGCADEPGEPEDRRGAAAGAAAPKRSGDERRRAERAAHGTDEAADGFVPLPEREADRDCDRRGDHERGERAAECAGRRDTE